MSDPDLQSQTHALIELLRSRRSQLEQENAETAKVGRRAKRLVARHRERLGEMEAQMVRFYDRSRRLSQEITQLDIYLGVLSMGLSEEAYSDPGATVHVLDNQKLGCTPPREVDAITRPLRERK